METRKIMYYDDYDCEFPTMSYDHYNWLCEMGDKILDDNFLEKNKHYILEGLIC